MKPTAGYAKPRRRAEPPTGRARLNLQRRPKPSNPEEEMEERWRGNLWKWVVAVALLHVLVILGASLYYWLFAPAPKPPDQFITLLPPGDVVHGSPGAQKAHKLGATQQAAPHRSAAPPPPAPAHVAPPQPKTVTPPPVVTPPSPTPIMKQSAPAPVKPVKPKPKPPTPAKPKVKVDLNEVERTDATDTPPKPAKHHAKKPVKNPDDSQDDTDSSPDNSGLSKQQIAEKLGNKLDASGAHNAKKYGTSGSPNGHANNFQDYYNMIGNQVQEAWNSPMSSPQNEPIVGMHVERDGHVVPESVHLITSSGDAAYDQAALDTVRHLGNLHEPLPDGCPPDITIRINPNP